MYTCVYIYMYTCMYICIYVHTRKWAPPPPPHRVLFIEETRSAARSSQYAIYIGILCEKWNETWCTDFATIALFVPSSNRIGIPQNSGRLHHKVVAHVVHEFEAREGACVRVFDLRRHTGALSMSGRLI